MQANQETTLFCRYSKIQVSQSNNSATCFRFLRLKQARSLLVKFFYRLRITLNHLNFQSSIFGMIRIKFIDLFFSLLGRIRLGNILNFYYLMFMEALLTCLKKSLNSQGQSNPAVRFQIP